MTQNPYAQFGAGGDFLDPVQRRTSVLAIVALVLAILCFIPGFGALALILGGAAVIFISKSNGRLGGLGLAITAIVLGLLVSLLQITFIGGAMSIAGAANQHFVGPVNKVLTGVANQDFAASRSMLSPRASAVITDQRINEFSKELKDELGAFKGGPDGILQLIMSYGQMGQQMEKFQGRNDVIPFPANFEKGMALVALKVDQKAGGASGTGTGEESVPLMNIGVITAGGKEIWLVDPDELQKLLKGKEENGGEASAPKPPADAPTPPEAPKAP